MCTKKRFTKIEAITALNHNKSANRQSQRSWNRKSDRRFRREVRYYHCSECNYWHLTSQDEYNEKKIEDIPLIEEDRWLKLLNNE